MKDRCEKSLVSKQNQLQRPEAISSLDVNSLENDEVVSRGSRRFLVRHILWIRRLKERKYFFLQLLGMNLCVMRFQVVCVVVSLLFLIVEQKEQ